MSLRSASATAGWASPDNATDARQPSSSVMFTVCPKCALTLVVTAEDLRVAQGYVRCGRCSSVFNALARLTEEGQTSEESAETAPPAPPDAPPQSVIDEDAIPEDALEFDPSKTDVASVFVEPPPNPQWTAATGTFKAMIAANQEAAPAQDPDSQQDSDSQIDVEIDPELLASILHLDLAEPPAPPQAPRPAERETPAPAPPETPPPPARQATPPATVQKAPRPAEREAPAPAPRETPPPPVRQATPPAGPAPQAPVKARSAASLARAPRKMRLGEELRAGAGTARLLPRLWLAGTGLAALLLLAQIVNHYRDELAATARFHRPITALYASLGVQLAPHWDLRAYEVHQLGASVEPG